MHFLPVVYFSFPVIVVGKNTWCDFSPFKFAKTCLMPYHVIYPGESFMYTWEEMHILLLVYGVFCICLLGTCSLKCNSHPLFPYWFSVCMIKLLLKVGYWSPLLYFIALCSPFRFVNNHLIHLGATIYGAYMFIVVISSIYSSLYHYIMTFFVSCYSFWLEDILSDIRMATPVLLCFPFVCNIFFVSSLSACPCPLSLSESL